MATFTAQNFVPPTAPKGEPTVKQRGLGPDGQQAPIPASATDGMKTDVWPGSTTILATIVLLLAGVIIGLAIQHPAFTPLASFNVFAVMYIVAQAIERLQDPFVPFMGRAQSDKTTVNQPTAIAARDKAVVNALQNPGSHAEAKKAAEAQRTVEQMRANLTLLMFGTSSALAMIASGWFGLYLLKAVGVTSGPLWVDLVVTGLAIGAGTKPLHDLISNLSASKTAKQDPVQTA
jgi:hypothetical protein